MGIPARTSYLSTFANYASSPIKQMISFGEKQAQETLKSAVKALSETPTKATAAIKDDSNVTQRKKKS